MQLQGVHPAFEFALEMMRRQFFHYNNMAYVQIGEGHLMQKHTIESDFAIFLSVKQNIIPIC